MEEAKSKIFSSLVGEKHMKRVAVIGAGYAGLAVSVGLAHFGAVVRCLDINEQKINQLSLGVLPIHEPDMEEMMHLQMTEGRLSFSTDLAAGIGQADIIFIAVGTPGQEKGSPDVTAVFSVADMIGQYAKKDAVVVVKSTVPVGTCEAVQARLREQTCGASACEVVANPEFLREGHALHDFLQPDRIVLGAAGERSLAVMRDLYAPLVETGVPLYTTDWQTAEMIKYSANSFLAMKVAFINEIARLCATVGADIETLSAALGADPRIGGRHLKPGPGYGGSCLPKDTEAFARLARQAGMPLSIIESVIESNQRQQTYVVQRVKQVLSDLRDRRIAVLGLAFKANTDDMRESPAISVIDHLLSERAQVTAYDPKAMKKARERWGGRIRYGKDVYEAAEGAHALLILTEWPEFLAVDKDKLARTMEEKNIFDFRNMYNRHQWKEHGFQYIGIGK
jgi:UDPglucose 6-dehydrogenase